MSRRSQDTAQDMDQLRILLRDIFFRARAISRRRLGHFGLTPTQFMVLAALMRNEGATVGHMADDLCVSPSTMSRIISQLEKGQYLRRAVGRGDRRQIRVFLRPRGRKLRERVRSFWMEMGREMFRDFSREEREALEHGLSRVFLNIRRVEAHEATS